MRIKFLSVLFFLCFLNFFVISASDYGENLENENYVISREKIERNINTGVIFEDFIEIKNKGSSSMNLVFSVKGEVQKILDLKTKTLSIDKDESGVSYFLIKGKKGFFTGSLVISGTINQEIPISINVSDVSSFGNSFLVEVSPIREVFDMKENISFQVVFKKIQTSSLENVSLNYTVNFENKTYFLYGENISFDASTSFIREFEVLDDFVDGEYSFFVTASKDDFLVQDETIFYLKTNFFDIILFGFLPVWVLVLVVSLIVLGFLFYYIIKKRIDSKKKYKMNLDLKTIPKKNKDFLFLGKIAETKHDTYFDPNKFTTHSIVAGATGGGKSITAQVLIEECLRKDIAVIVFDPTAQWSGMLRKCTDKKMMSFYPKFGLKPKDAQAFKGNVRMIKNSRQKLDLNRYINPGQIQIFSLNKLDPKEMDIFVASIIRQIFKSDPKEYPGLKVLLVFDEVHRLLPKFGGSGEGFLQIERGCREFRKWGMGIMLVSQVLNDFVGAIKANISTEVQMRTRDEGDLNRIKTKYGEEFLQSLVKASTGVGMFANPAYNHAKPYFVNFRPILHNTRRLTDEELEEYNKYNDQVDEVEFQIEKLEEEKVDVFDLKMELKLIKDKIMTGSFSVVQIYLDGLVPRVKKEWEKIGKQPPKMVIELISEEEIQKAISEAKSKHDKEKAKEKEAGEDKVEKVSLLDKIVPSVTFDNGAMISSLKEMIDYLPSMDDSDFKKVFVKGKNKIMDWVSSQFGEENAKILEGKETKEDIIKVLEKIGKGEEGKEEKESKGEVKEEKKEENKDEKSKKKKEE